MNCNLMNRMWVFPPQTAGRTETILLCFLTCSIEQWQTNKTDKINYQVNDISRVMKINLALKNKRNRCTRHCQTCLNYSRMSSDRLDIRQNRLTEGILLIRHSILNKASTTSICSRIRTIRVPTKSLLPFRQKIRKQICFTLIKQHIQARDIVS